MVRLKNINKLSSGISADYYPEDKQEHGHVVLDGEYRIIEKELAAVDAYGFYLAKARKKLMQLEKSGEPIPEEALMIWY